MGLLTTNQLSRWHSEREKKVIKPTLGFEPIHCSNSWPFSLRDQLDLLENSLVDSANMTNPAEQI